MNINYIIKLGKVIQAQFLIISDYSALSHAVKGFNDEMLYVRHMWKRDWIRWIVHLKINRKRQGYVIWDHVMRSTDGELEIGLR